MSRKLIFKSIFIVALVAAIFSVLPLRAQNSNSQSSQYDISQEVKIQGTIETIGNSSPGSNTNGPLGIHILIQTAQGAVDAHLGVLNAASQKALNLSTGETVTALGMMNAVDGNSVLFVRILTTPNGTFVLRNLHGIPVKTLVPNGNLPQAKGGL